MHRFLPLLLLASILPAQEPVAPTPERAGTPRGESWGGYNVVNSFETGYRFASVSGNDDMYRSTVNYGNGVRLLGSHFTMNSKEGTGRWFDTLTLTTQGLGNDPYEYAGFRLEKKRTYLYDMNWRRNDYFNPGLVTGGATGDHLLDTEYRMQDHDFTLFPDSRLQFFLGFTGSSQTGAAITSVQPLQPGNDALSLFANVQRVRREYRVGNEFRVFGVRVNWIRGWDDFKEDTPPASVPGPPQLIEPYHGTSPYWRVGVFYDWRALSLNGRFTYTDGARNFVVDETVVGPGAPAQSRQSISTGDAARPVTTGNLNIAAAAGKLSVVNSTSYYDVETNGNAQYTEIDNGTGSFDVLNYQYLGIKTFANETDLNYQFAPWIGAFTGYAYSDRTIRSVEQVTVAGTAFPTVGNQNNHLHDVRAGFRLRPLKPLTILASVEAGRASHPFTPIAGRDYQVVNGRVQYRSGSLLLSAGAQSDYSFNSTSFTSYGVQSRKYFVDGSWTIRPRLTVDGSFTRSHLYTIGGIAYFENFQLIEGMQSIYISNLNTIHAGVQLTLTKRINLYAAYVRSQDFGDGRGVPPSDSPFAAAQTFPMTFESPLARISVLLSGRLRWNAGYQYYGYRARFDPSRDFHANTGYTSLSWSF
jgi:hypothetical protein